MVRSQRCTTNTQLFKDVNAITLKLQCYANIASALDSKFNLIILKRFLETAFKKFRDTENNKLQCCLMLIDTVLIEIKGIQFVTRCGITA